MNAPCTQEVTVHSQLGYTAGGLGGQFVDELPRHKRKNDRRDIHPLYTQVDVQEPLDDPASQLVLAKYRKMRS
jgi:hypothetical protein